MIPAFRGALREGDIHLVLIGIEEVIKAVGMENVAGTTIDEEVKKDS